MDDLETRLRAAVRQRADELEPTPDLPDRIRARVAHRRRQHRLRTGALGTAAAVVVALGLSVAVARPGDDGSVEVGDHRRTTTTSEPERRTTSTTERTTTTTATSSTTVPSGPTGNGGTGGTGGGDGPSGTAAPPSDQSPDETSPTSTATTAPPDLEPPDGETPAAGTCSETGGATVEVVLAPDVPWPRCARVTADQRLQVRNDTDETVTVSFASFGAELAPGAAQLFDRPFGEYLQPGVHRVDVSLYGGSGPEIWLVP